jgi:hypothetical protein
MRRSVLGLLTVSPGKRLLDKLPRIFLWLILLFFALEGCVVYPKHDEYQRKCSLSSDRKDPDKIPVSTEPVVLQSIRLTDYGQHVDRCELTELLKVLGQQVHQIVVLYIHGWKHNSDESDSDKMAFHLLLKSLRKKEEQTSSPRQVVGAYIGWNGKTTLVPIPLIEEFTFWARKRAADRVTESGVLAKIIGAIAHVRELQQQPDDLLLLMGHSFGARILYSATANSLLYETQRVHPGKRGNPYGEMRGLADLIVLLNPAFEALRYIGLDSLRRPDEPFCKQRQPLLLTIATDNDWATNIAFPLGQLIGFEWRPIQHTTIGNFEDYITHDLLPLAEQSADTTVKHWYDQFCQGSICLRKKDSLAQGNPFLMTKTNEAVLNGHNGIWTDSFLRWLTGFVFELDRRKKLTMIPSSIESVCDRDAS